LGFLAGLAEMSPVIQLVALVLASYILEDATSITAGILWGQGILSGPVTFVGVLLGIVSGDLLLYALGRGIGRHLLNLPLIRGIVSEADVQRWQQWFERRGLWVVLATRFVPGTRLPCYLSAGVLRVNPWRFALAATLSALAQSVVVLPLAAQAGAVMLERFAFFRETIVGVLILIGCIWLCFRLLPILFDPVRRRLLWLDVMRQRSHEFWPFAIFYAPVFAYCAWLAWKHGGWGLPTAANPGMFCGGFTGDSKAETLRSYQGPEGWVARFIVCEPGPRHNFAQQASTGEVDRRMESLLEQLLGKGLGFPLVAKPDQGERGSGVRLLRDVADLRAYLEGMWHVPFLVQEYVLGPQEWGVFYIRHPHEERGRIFSIVEKKLPTVTGDGVRTLTDLILADPRARLMARVFLKRHVLRADDIPTAGEQVRLVEAGNHCQGAIFRDGRRHITPALEATVERLSRGFPGFHFGRFDIRFETPESFARGEAFKVLELNGASAEATHVWDPEYTAIMAWRDLFAQFRHLWEIGAANAKAGARVWTIAEVVKLRREFRRIRAHHPPTD